MSDSNKISRSERLRLQAFKNVMERRNGKLNSKENENKNKYDMSDEKNLKKTEKDLIEKIKEFENNIGYLKNFGDYEWINIRRICQIEYEYLLKNLNKNSSINSILSRFDLKARERSERFVNELNKEEFNKCMDLFIEFYKNDLKLKFLSLC
ncbi:hypothetical protein [Winogradskyella sp.]|uniref:hypothetical protein n=1 Tax=Winogradskyella sp. TaxID=1883156 RepID=UPI003AB63925